MVLNIIVNNSFRILGVFSNSPKRELIGNKSRYNAFLRVNQPVPVQPRDLSSVLPVVNRDLDTLNGAEREVSVPAGRLTQSLFWFVNTGPDDEAALNSLSLGDMDASVRAWRAGSSAASLQNLMVCHLIAARYREALIVAQNMLSVHFEEWREMLSLLPDVTSEDVARIFLDTLYSEVPDELSVMDWSGLPVEWSHQVKGNVTDPIIDRITSQVEKCKAAKSDTPKEKYKDGFSLLESVQPILVELESLLNEGDLILQSIEDKVYSEILDCSISSYNAVYEELHNGNSDSFREIAPRCNELVNSINTAFLSPIMARRVTEDKETINESCDNIEKTIERVQNLMIKCPECGEDSSAIKQYTMPRLFLFLFAGYRVETVRYTCCSKCMRKHILWHGFTYNILAANVLWPFVILPWCLILLIMSFTKGHSDSVLAMLNESE